VNHIDKERLKTFITIQGLINAGLFIWVQYWAKTYDIYTTSNPPSPVWHVSLFISMLYISVFVSLISIIFAFLSFNKSSTSWFPRISISLFSLSFLSILAIIIASLVGIIPKAFEGATRWYAWGVSSLDPRWWTCIAYGSMFIIFILLLILSKWLVNIFLKES
jgi:hypothetical protein